jgi:hypothetical protein
MSLVKVSGNASGTGTLTIAAPNTNSDYTLTLPTGTGTFNISGVVNEVPAGTVSAPSIYPTGDTNTGIFFPAADTIAFTEGGTEAMRIDSSGNLLVGVTANSNSERLMVKSSGNTGSTSALRIENSSSTAIFLIRDDGYLRSPTTYNLTGGTANLSIDSSGFITRATSSLRYKRDIVNYDKGLEVVSQLRPVYYKSSVAGADGNIPDTQFAGMIAEELDALGLTEFVEYGAENQVEAIRYGNMVALLTKAIQEQQAIITALTARITVLENK